MSDPFERLSTEDRELLHEEPFPEWLDPMLATLTDDHFSDPDWLYERKLDGERVLAYRSGEGVRLVSRNATELDDTYPELRDAVGRASSVACVLDGEVVAFEGSRTSFSKLQPRLQVSDPDEARASDVAVFFYVFDVLHLDGRSTRDLPLRTRKSVLQAAVAFDDPLRRVAHRNEDGEAWLEEACAKGWEGLIAKRADAPYHHGRSRDWLKFKCVNQQTLEHLGDLLAQRERRTSPFDDGPDDAGLHFVTPELVAEVGFTEWTRDGRLRHPRYLGLRHDKDAHEVVRESAS